MNKKMNLTVTICFSLLIGAVFAQSAGETTFKTKCAACHTIGKGKLVGPDLAGVTARRDENWLKKQIKTPDVMIAEKDPVVMELLKESNNVPMAPLGLTDAEVSDVIAYLKTAGEVAPATAQPSQPATQTAGGNAENGQNLFVGIMRFANGGPTCNSCHNVNSDAVISGGALAKDLTDSYSRLTEAGVKAFFSGSSLPIPQMNQAFNGKPLTETEVADVTAFLAKVDKEKALQANTNYGKYLLYGGVPGAIILLLIFSVSWIGRRKKAVNHKVFDRQVYN